MKLSNIAKMISESKSDGGIGLNTMRTYLAKKLGRELIKIPGIEHFKNSAESGFGVRFVEKGSTRCVRFNWSTEGTVGKLSNLLSIDLFTGNSRDPNFTIHTKGISIVQALPMVVAKLISPEIGKDYAFPVSAQTALSEEVAVFEARREDYTAEGALDDFLNELKRGKAYTRSEFIARYHIVHAGLFDAIVEKFKDSFQISGKRVSMSKEIDVDSLHNSILSKAGVVEVSKGGSKEVYMKSKQEEELEKQERVPYVETLEHLEGLVKALIKGSYNALFVAGKGGSLSGETSINIIINDGNSDIDDLNKTKDSQAN